MKTSHGLLTSGEQRQGTPSSVTTMPLGCHHQPWSWDQDDPVTMLHMCNGCLTIEPCHATSFIFLPTIKKLDQINAMAFHSKWNHDDFILTKRVVQDIVHKNYQCLVVNFFHLNFHDCTQNIIKCHLPSICAS